MSGVIVVPDHGSLPRYHGRTGVPPCRCSRCTRAATRADAERRLDRLAGRPRQVPSDRVRRHLRSLAAAGKTFEQIGAAAGVPASTVAQQASGKRGSILARTEAKLLAVRPEECADLMVASVGAVRRIRALYVMGHGPVALAAATGMHRDMVTGLASGHWQRLAVGRDAAVRGAYDRLWNVPGASVKARQWAARQGWVSPLAWDDDKIDDPAAVPAVDVPEAGPDRSESAVDRWLHGEAVVLDDTGRRRALAHLMEYTSLTPGQVGERLGMSEAAVKRSWERVKARAREAGAPVPRRRMVAASVPQLAAAA